MFDIPAAFAEAGYFQGVDRILWYAAMALTFTSGVIFLLRRRQADHEATKNWYLGFAMFSFSYGFTRLFFNLGVDLGYADTSGTTAVYDLYTGLAYLFAMPGAIVLIYVAETQIFPKTHKLITVSVIVGLVASVLGVVGVYPREWALTITMVVALLATGLIVIIFITLLRYSTGSIRKKTMGAFTGIAIWVLAILMDGEWVYSGLGMHPIVPPILYLVGMGVYTTFQRVA